MWSHCVEAELGALQPCAPEAFPLFRNGTRTAHVDGHVEVAGVFYPVPLALLGQRVRVQWDDHLVRVLHNDLLTTVHHLVPPGVYAPRPGEATASTRQQGFVDRLSGQCVRVGPSLRTWADAAVAARGVRAIPAQGVLRRTRRVPHEWLLAAAQRRTRNSRTGIRQSAAWQKPHRDPSRR